MINELQEEAFERVSEQHDVDEEDLHFESWMGVMEVHMALSAEIRALEEENDELTERIQGLERRISEVEDDA